VTPDDLTLEADYFRAKLRRHNRYLHGWGVVCGAEVVPAYFVDNTNEKKPKPWKVIVKAGYVLGPYGDEIFVESDQCVDVRKLCVTPEATSDEECIEAYPTEQPSDNNQQWLAIRYVEKETRLIRIPLGGCGCEDKSCEFTRFRDSYEICVIDHCPDSHRNPPESLGKGIENGATAPSCPECQEEPWVVLSAFTVDETGKVELQQCDCRRQVVSFGNAWWSCSVSEDRTPTNDGIDTSPGVGTPPRPGTATPAQPAGTATPAQPSGTATPAQPAGTATPASAQPVGSVVTAPAQPTATAPATPGATKSATKKPSKKHG
jgi:hypothetical protein